MAAILPRDLPAAGAVNPNAALITDDGIAVQKATPLDLVNAAIPLATQSEAEAGADNVKRTTALRVKQAVDAQIKNPLADSSGSTLVKTIQAGTGAVARTVQDKARDTVSVKDFGALGDDATDDTVAFLRAATAVSAGGGGSVRIPRGAYRLNRVQLAGLSNVEFIGSNATIRGTTGGRVHSYFDCSSANNISFRSIRFDQMKSSLPPYTSGDYAGGPLQVPIRSTSGNGINVANCWFDDLYTSAIYFEQGIGLTVRECLFGSGVQTQTQWIQHIHTQTCTDVLVDVCQFKNAAITNPDVGVSAIFASGVRRITVSKNYMDYCGRNNAGTHRLGAIDFYGDVTDVRVLDNIVTNCMAVAIRLNACKGGRINGNRFQVNSNAESDGNTIEVSGSIIFGENKGSLNVEICGNEFEDPASRAAVTVLIPSYDWGAPARGVSVHDNMFTGCRNIVRVFGPFDGVRIAANRGGAGRSAIVVVPGTGITADMGSEANSTYRRLAIVDNELTDTSGDSANAILLALSNATTALVDQIEVRDNRVKASPASAAVGIVAQLNSSDRARTRSKVTGNIVEDYSFAFDVKDHGSCDLVSNRATGTTQFLLTSSMVNTPFNRGNFNNSTAVPETALAT